MTSENATYALNTIKGHGLAVGDRVMFHGMGSDPIPTAEGTRVEIGKVGAKYILTTVSGEVMTWEFGASAKVWCDTTIAHHVTTEARTLDNGDTVHVGACEHGWMTGFHTSEADAYAVAEGHGEVSRPLYVAPVNVPEVGTVVVTSDGDVGMVEARYSDGRVNVFGIVECASVGVHSPASLTVITDDMIKSAKTTIQQNGRVFVAESRNFSVPSATWSVLVAHGWAVQVDNGPMSRWVRARRTADRKVITDGLAVWDYNGDAGRVALDTMDGDGWFYVDTVKGDRSLMNGERVTTVHPFTRQAAAEAVNGPVDTDACDTHPGGYNIPGTAVCVGCEADGTHTIDGPVLDIPTPAEVDALILEHDTAMSAWVAPLVKALTKPMSKTGERETAWIKRELQANEPIDPKGFGWSARVISELIFTGAIAEVAPGSWVANPSPDASDVAEAEAQRAGELAACGSVEPITEAEVWKGTGTTVKARRCNRLHSGRRCDRVTSGEVCPCVSLAVRPSVKHKRTKVTARRVRGGF